MKNTKILEYLLHFLLGASWAIFVLWILFPPFKIFGSLLLNRLGCAALAGLFVAFCYFLLGRYEIRNNK